MIQAQGIAAQIGVENISDATRLEQIVTQAAAQVGGRVIAVDDRGILVADSKGPGSLGTSYATSGRPEIGRASCRERVLRLV